MIASAFKLMLFVTILYLKIVFPPSVASYNYLTIIVFPLLDHESVKDVDQPILHNSIVDTTVYIYSVG